jgi:hypothetical protein
MADNKSIKFPTHHYIGFQARPSVDDVPLGFMTPDGKDKAAEKRKATVDNWAQGYGYDAANKAKDKMPAQTYENKPLVGFKLGRNVRHGYGWGQGNVKWRIEDPRGFELEISSPNFAQLIGFCNIEQGEILEPCIWARLGAENILVPVNSDVYRATVRNTERLAKKASMKDLKIGDSVVLANGDEGVYYGAFYVSSYEQYHGNTNRLGNSGKKRHVFLFQTPGDDGTSSHKFFRAVGSPKLAELFDGGETMTHLEAEKFVNDWIKEGKTFQESGTRYVVPIGVSIEPMDKSHFTQTEETLSYSELVADLVAKNPTMASNLSYLLSYGSGRLFADWDGTMVNVDLRNYNTILQYLPGGANHHFIQNHPNYNFKLDWPMVKKDIYEASGEIEYHTQANTSRWNSHLTTQCKHFDVSKDTLPALMRIKMSGKTQSGTEFSFYR